MKITRVNKMKQQIMNQLGVLSFLILSACGQNSHMTMDAATTPADTTAPTANLSGGVSGVTNTALQTITVTFSEAVVAGISAGDFNITNGTLSNLNCIPALAPTSCTFDVTASGQGAVNVQMPASAVQDAAGNNNDASNAIAWTFDSIGPTVSIAIEVGEPASGSSTNDSSIALTLTASEALAALVAGDFTCTNCTVSGISGSGTSWTLNVIPSGLGAVSVELAASAVQDGAGNSNVAASNNLNWTYNNVAPALTLAPASGAPASGSTTNTSPIAVELTSSAIVTGLVAGDIVCTGCTINNFSGSGASYSFNVLPSGQGAFSVNVPASVAQDAATNQNTASNTLNWNYDTSAPSATLAVGSGGAASGSTTNAASIPITVSMGESVTGLIAGDFTCTNCTLSGFSGSGSSYSFNVVPTASGAVSVQLPAASAADAAGNGNTISNALSWTYDNTAPTVVLSGTPVSGYANSAQTITATFSESMNVGTLSSADVSVTNGSVSAFSCSGSPTSCTFTVTATANGTVTVAMNASVAQDNAGNNNTAATNISWTHDTTAPTIASDAPGSGGSAFGSSITTSSTVNVDVTLSEAVQTSSVTAADFAVTSPGSAATISSVSCASNTVCTVTINVSSVASSGAVSLELNSPSILDLAGNSLSATTLPTTATWNFTASPSYYDQCLDVAIDSSNNRICVGSTSGNIGESNGDPTNASADFFIMKTDSSGALLWTKQGGLGAFGAQLPGGDTSRYDQCTSVAIDSADNIYCLGHTSGSLGEANSSLLSGEQNAFIIKLDPNGDFLWIKQVGSGAFGSSFPGGSSGLVHGYQQSFDSLAIGSDDQPVFAFATLGSYQEDWSSGFFSMVVVKIDSDGDFLFAKQAGSESLGGTTGLSGAQITGGISLGVDRITNAVFVVANQSNPGNCGTSTLIGFDSILGYSWHTGYSSGEQTSSSFAPPCAGGGTYSGNSVLKVSKNENALYVAYSQNISYTAHIGNASKTEVYVDKYDFSGNRTWSNTINHAFAYSSHESPNVVNIALNPISDDIYIVSTVAESVGELNAGSGDVLLSRLDKNGTFMGYQQAGSGAIGTPIGNLTLQEYCYSIEVDSSDKIICGGNTNGTSFSTIYHEDGGSGDIMIMEFDANASWYQNDLFSFGGTNISANCIGPDTFEWFVDGNLHCNPADGPVTISGQNYACSATTINFSGFSLGTGSSGSPTVAGSLDAYQGIRNIKSHILSGSGISCVAGCTDPGAQNYDSNATWDDGSCVF